MKRAVALFLLILWGVGCYAENPKALSINLQEGQLPSLNPYVGVDLRSRCLYLGLFQPLMRKNSDGALECAAAESVEIDPTQTIYTFHIRPHTWSNGEPVTSSHFADAWRLALSPASSCIRANLFYPIKNGEKVKRGELPLQDLKVFTPDEQTLIVELEQPTPYFLDLAATSFFSPLFDCKEAEPAHFNGPFVVGECAPDQRLTFVKNPLYWDADSIELQEIHFTMVKDPMAALAMYERGELDVVGDPFSSLPLDSIPSLKHSGRLQSKSMARIFYLFLNTTAYPFHNKSLRRALALSIDRAEVVEQLFNGEEPSLSLIPKPLSLLPSVDFEQGAEDPVLLFEQALQELQITREQFPTLTYSFAKLAGQKEFAEYLQQTWKEKLGINLEIECAEWNRHLVKLKGKDFQIAPLHLTAIYPDLMFYLDIFRNKATLGNYSGWDSVEFTDLLKQSEMALDSAERALLLQKAEWALFQEMPVIPVFTQNFQYLTQDSLNLVISELGIYDFKVTNRR